MNRASVKDFFTSHFFIVTCLILLKTILLRYLLFDELNIVHTFTLELSYILIFTSLIELISFKGKKTLFFFINILFSVFFLAVAMYFSYFGRIVTYNALMQAGQVGDIGASVTALIKPVYILFFIDLIILLISLIIRKYPIHTKNVSKKVLLPILVLAIGVSLLNLFLNKDEFISNNVVAAEDQGVLNYETIEIAFGSTNQIPSEYKVAVKNVKSLKAKINDLKGLTNIPEENRNYFNAAGGRNLIVIQVESMQNFPIGLKIDGQEVTPNLNDLVEKSFYFSRTFQQTGPGNTSDAEFIMNTSLYPVAYNPTSQTYGNKKFPSLPRLLREKGYETMTFHADEVTFWNRDELYPALGFDQYYDQKFIGTKDTIGMGASDEVLFSKALRVMQEKKLNNQPFYAQLVTLTSHHPFTVPADRINLKLPSKYKGTLTGAYLEAMNYNDMAIGKLIDGLKKAGIYDNSVIVIYGDHFGLQQSAISQKDVDLVSELLGHEYQTLDRMNIPFIINAPGITDEGQKFDKLGGQLDMMPTVANLLGVSLDNQIVFGQDLLNSDDNLLGVRYYLPVGSFFNKDILFKPEKGFEDGTAYDLNTEAVVKDFTQYRKDYDRVIELENLSDSYMESLPEREK